MRKIKKLGAQGDVLFIRVDALPEGLERTADNVVAHSETGHHHVAVGDITRYIHPTNDMSSYIVARGPVQIEHKRDYDTHETMELLDSGRGETIWEARRQRESTPEGWRKVMD